MVVPATARFTAAPCPAGRPPHTFPLLLYAPILSAWLSFQSGLLTAEERKFNQEKHLTPFSS